MIMQLHSVKIRRLVRADRNRVFSAFSNVDALSQWFSPKPEIDVDIKVFDFTPQGEFRICYTMPDGSQPAVGGVFEVIKEHNQIIFTWRWEAPDPHADIPTRVNVQFIDRGSDTEVFLTHDKLPKEACERHAEGWEATLERLEPFLSITSIIAESSGVWHHG